MSRTNGGGKVTLALDTAAPVAGIGLWDGQRAHERTLRVTRGTEEVLPGLIEVICRDATIAVGQVEGVGVVVGPGAFTGLRVGVATAAGLASALGVPVWPASSLFIRAARAGFGGDLLVCLDARKGRVYAAHWHNETLANGPGDVAPEVALSWLEQRPFRATGEGAMVYAGLIAAAGGTVVGQADQPGTGLLARLSSEALARGQGIDPIELRTEYLREPDAIPRRTGSV